MWKNCLLFPEIHREMVEWLLLTFNFRLGMFWPKKVLRQNSHFSHFCSSVQTLQVQKYLYIYFVRFVYKIYEKTTLKRRINWRDIPFPDFINSPKLQFFFLIWPFSHLSMYIGLLLYLICRPLCWLKQWINNASVPLTQGYQIVSSLILKSHFE